MEITINASADEVLGGPEWSPYLELELTEAGEVQLHTGERHSSEQNSTTFDRWHGRTLYWRNSLSQGCYALADTAAIEALADQVKPLLACVHAGHSTHWDGSNYRGRLTEDAEDASDELDRIFETAAWCDEDRHVWDASEWLSTQNFAAIGREFGLTVNSDETAFEAAGRQLEQQASSDGVVLVEVDKALERIKEALEEEADAGAA